MARCRAPWWRMGLVSALAVLAIGCGGEATVEPFTPATGEEAATLFWDLTVDHPAATISTVPPYDTIRLVATPRDAYGNPIAGLGPVTFRSGDTRLAVTPDGLVRALGTGTSLLVYADLTVGNTTHTTSVLVNVTDEASPPVLARLEVLLPGGTTWPVNGDGTFLSIDKSGVATTAGIQVGSIMPVDTMGNSIASVIVKAHSSDTTVVNGAAFGSFLLVNAIGPGHATMDFTATAYGVTVTKSIDISITMPVFGVVRIVPQPATLGGPLRPTFVPASLTVRAGGDVVWANASGEPVDIIFDDPANVVEHGSIDCGKAGVSDVGGTGNIDAFGAPQDTAATTLGEENCRSRSFPVPGTYTYHSTRTGAVGRVVVTEGPTP